MARRLPSNKGRIHLRRPTLSFSFSLANRRRTIHSGWLTNWTESVPSNAATWAFYVQLDCHRFARSGTNPGIAAALSALHCGSAAKRCPIRPAGGGAGRPLSLPYGCRPELRQLHSLVRPHPYTANGTKRRVRLMYSRYSSPKRATSALSSILAEAPKAIVDITARASVVVDPDFTGLPASGSAVKCTADAVRLNEPGSIRNRLGRPSRKLCRFTRSARKRRG